MSFSKRIFRISCSCLLWALCVTALSGQDMALSDVLVEGEGWTLVASGYRFTDAAATDQDGNFYFADVAQGDSIYRIAVDGTVSKLPVMAERISGLQFGPDRRLYACQGGNPGKILAIDPSGTVSVIATDVQPNDLVVTRRGVIYFTETGKAQITSIAPGEQPSMAAKGPLKPNGIALSPDHETLAVSDYEGEHVWTWRIRKDGSLDAGHPYMTMRLAREDQPSHGDGMTTDAQGRYFVTTAAGLQMFDPTGRLSGVIATPQAQPMVSVEFSGPELRYLYVCNGDKIFRRKTKSQGNVPAILQ